MTNDEDVTKGGAEHSPPHISTESLPVVDPAEQDVEELLIHQPPPGTVVLQPSIAPRRPQWGLISAVIALAVLILAFAATVFASQQATIGSQSTRISEMQNQISELTDVLQVSQETAQDLFDQVEQLGEDPVTPDPDSLSVPEPLPEDDSESSPQQGERGEVGPPPSMAQIAAAVTDFCLQNGLCKGPDGETPSEEVLQGMVAQAVAIFCANDACKGDPGQDGVDGLDGNDGATGGVGPTGPPGPTCPEGYYVDEVWINISDEETGPSSSQPAMVCRPNPPVGE